MRGRETVKERESLKAIYAKTNTVEPLITDNAGELKFCPL
jgi:hypothetical protein